MTLQLGRVVACDTAISPSRECLHFWYVRQNFGCTQILCLTHSLVIFRISSLFALGLLPTVFIFYRETLLRTTKRVELRSKLRPTAVVGYTFGNHNFKTTQRTTGKS